ncbi:hypothetical protein [Streptomyces flavidovirens]|uniref:hypothetical protein n=1 Tax=Streptomyces flavidovirens TaxID=67298 RepID=UPI0004047C35|nr:hypothetical protein [Streptomyces flavidovirens]
MSGQLPCEEITDERDTTGARSFALWADPYRQRRIATVVTTAASGGVATYQVLGEQGEIIGTLTRERASSGRRRRRTRAPADHLAYREGDAAGVPVR